MHERKRATNLLVLERAEPSGLRSRILRHPRSDRLSAHGRELRPAVQEMQSFTQRINWRQRHLPGSEWGPTVTFVHEYG